MIPSAVVDTHTIIWYLNADARLSGRAKRFIDEAGRRGMPVLISSISLVEVVYLCEKGRITLDTLARLEEALHMGLPTSLHAIPRQSSFSYLCQRPLSQGHGRQDGGNSTRQHRLPHAWKNEHEDNMVRTPASGSPLR
jgi:hypothetical protein